MNDILRFIFNVVVIIIAWYALKIWKKDWDEELPTYKTLKGKIFGNCVKYIQLVIGFSIVYWLCTADGWTITRYTITSNQHHYIKLSISV